MSKNKVKQYLSTLDKEALIHQIIELYSSVTDVNKYYEFIINPDELKIIQKKKEELSKEYFPTSGKKAKARRSKGLKAIKELTFLGVSPDSISDFRLFAIEIAVIFSIDHKSINNKFCISFAKQFHDTLKYMKKNAVLESYKTRCEKIIYTVNSAEWFNIQDFKNLFNQFYI